MRDHGESTSAFDGPLNIFTSHLRPFQRHHSLAVFSRNVTARNAGVDRVDLDRRHQFRFFNRFLDGLDGAFDINDDSFA